jgi:hypothetical protein
MFWFFLNKIFFCNNVQFIFHLIKIDLLKKLRFVFMKGLLRYFIISISILFINSTFQGICVFIPTISNPLTSGILYLNYDNNLNTTNVTGYIAGFQPNSYHGLHVHIKGDISNPDGTSSGLHWNPYNAPRNNYNYIDGFLNGTDSLTRRNIIINIDVKYIY